MLKFSRVGDENYGCAEPLFFNPFFKLQSPLLGSVIKMFLNAGVTRVIDLLDIRRGQWDCSVTC